MLVPARLARGAVGSRRLHEVVPVPQRAAGHQLDADPRRRHPDRVHRADRHRRHPRDVLQARPGSRVRVDPGHHERAHARLARARHAQVGRQRLHHPHVPAHGAHVPVRRVQVPARAELDRRRAAARERHGRGLHRLPAAVGPDGVLGHRRRHQHQRHRAVRRAVPGAVPAGRSRDRARHAVEVLRPAHARPAGRDHGA